MEGHIDEVESGTSISHYESNTSLFSPRNVLPIPSLL
jgi:hypothetical protein